VSSRRVGRKESKPTNSVAAAHVPGDWVDVVEKVLSYLAAKKAQQNPA
jgi:hypothetical protein